MIFVALLLAFAQAAGQSTPAAPGPATPPASDTQPVAGADPATVTFTTPAGALLVTVKPTATADYEAAITALQQALSASDDVSLKALAEGWRVFKATEPDAKGNAIYVHFVTPAVAAADYRPSLLLDRLLTAPPSDLLARYRDAFAQPPTKLSLTELAHMAVPPAPKPANATPPQPTAPKPPGR